MSRIEILLHTKNQNDDIEVGEYEDDEIFEITDFSIATKFEKFISDIEKKIEQLFINSEKSIYQHDTIHYNSIDITIHFFDDDDNNNNNQNVIKEMLDDRNDFPSVIESRHLYRWFGVKRYILLTSNDEIDKSFGNSLLSGLVICMNFLQSDIPFFVDVNGMRDGTYIGRCYTRNSELIKFNSESLKEVPPFCTFLGGLLDLFQLNLSKWKGLNRDVKISSRFAYEIESRKFKWKKTMKKFNNTIPNYLMNWGTLRDPVESISISCKWDSFNETSMKNMEERLKPNQSLNWRISYLKDESNDAKLVNFLKYLCDIYKEVMVESMKKKKGSQPTIFSTKELEEEEIGEVKDSIKKIFDYKVDVDGDYPRRGLSRSFPEGSLLSLFTIQSSFFDNVYQINLFWKEFVEKLSNYWEEKKIIPNISEKKPEWSDSLMYQKLVMLNCCIKKIREMNIVSIVEEQQHEVKSDDEVDSEEESDGESEDDEFFDVEDEESSKIVDKLSSIRLKELEDVKSTVTGEDIWIPKTREIPPYTQDMIINQQEILSKLGNSDKAAEYRAKYQSASLFSDMQSFKAANPECSFVDFTKWYSPSDITVDGKLSKRMKNSKLWKDLWESSKPIAYDKQDPLLDYEKEGELVIRYFESLEFKKVIRELLIHLYVAAYYTLRRIDIVSNIEYVKDELEKLKKKLKNFCSIEYPSMDKTNEMNNSFEKMEILMAVGVSLTERFDNPKAMSNIISQLCEHLESELKNTKEKEEILNCIRKDDRFIDPTTREFIIREDSGHRMYVCFQVERLFRFATAFKEPYPFFE